MELENDVCGCYAVWNWKVMFVVVMLCGTGSDVCGVLQEEGGGGSQETAPESHQNETSPETGEKQTLYCEHHNLFLDLYTYTMTAALCM